MSRSAPRIGLVLGAGGITGFAYHSGVLSSLNRLTGWDPRTSEVIVGTSAGSGFGTMLRGGVLVDEVIAHLLAAPSDPETMARLRVLSGREQSSPSMLWFGPAAPRLLVECNPRLLQAGLAWRIRPSRVAVSLLPNGRIPTDFLGDRVRGLHGLDWPDRALWICAIGLVDGQRAVFGLNRIDQLHDQATKATSNPVTIDAQIGVSGFPSAALASLGLREATRRGAAERNAQTVIVNVQGPREQLTVLGRPVTEISSAPPLAAGVRLGFGVFSYLDKLTFGVTTDRRSVPDADVVVTGLRNAVAQLIDRAGD